MTADSRRPQTAEEVADESRRTADERHVDHSGSP
jgi:hypothetical protein